MFLALLKQHQPCWVLIELGGNDDLSGFPSEQLEQLLDKAISEMKDAGEKPLLMQVRLPASYGRR